MLLASESTVNQSAKVESLKTDLARDCADRIFCLFPFCSSPLRRLSRRLLRASLQTGVERRLKLAPTRTVRPGTLLNDIRS